MRDEDLRGYAESLGLDIELFDKELGEMETLLAALERPEPSERETR